MKTPDEIKKGLEYCALVKDLSCVDCPYYRDCSRNTGESPELDAIAYIQQLEEKLKAYEWYEGERNI